MSSEPTPTDSTPSAPETPRLPARAAEISASPPPPEKKGSLPERAARHIFSPDTRTGRIVRPIVRGLGFSVGFFALGLLACYLLLYQPAELRASSLQTQLEQARSELDSKQAELRTTTLNLAGSESDRKAATGALEKLQARLALQAAQTGLVQVRLALAQKDSATASLALKQLEGQLKDQMPTLQKLAAANPDNISKILDLTRGDLDRDANLANQDLQRLASELELLDQALR